MQLCISVIGGGISSDHIFIHIVTFIGDYTQALVRKPDLLNF